MSAWASRKDRLAAILFLILAALFLGRALFPPSGQALGAHDMRALFYPWFDYVQAELAQGRLPLWDPYQFNGYPFLHNPQVGFFYPPTWLAILLPTGTGIGLYVLVHLWLAALGMFLFVRQQGSSWAGALLSALVFAFSGFVGARLWAGHIGVVATVAWLPWLLAALSWSVTRKTLAAGLVAGLPLGLAFLAGHTPSFFYLLIVWLAFGLYLWLGEERGPRVVRQAGLAAGLALGLAAIQALPLIQLSLRSQRVSGANLDFATRFSLPPAHLTTLLVPGFFGDPVRTGYWSVPVFEELVYYIGLVALVGLVLGVARRSRLSWFYLLLLLSGLWLALGRYGALYGVLFDLLPPFRIIRAPARAAILYLFAGAALLGHAVTAWQQAPAKQHAQRLDRLLRWTLTLGGLAGFAALAATGAVFMALHPTETSGRLWHQIGGYATALIVVLLGGLLLYGWLTIDPSRQHRRRFLFAGLVLVTVADLWQFSRPLLQTESMAPPILWTAAKERLGRTTERILPWGVPIFDQTGALQVGLASVFGYQALEPARLLALAESVPDPRSSAYDLLGVRYVLSSAPLDQYTAGDVALEPLGTAENAWIYQRPRALPIVRLVYEAEIIPDSAAAVARIHQPDFRAAETAILATEPPCDLGPTPTESGMAELEVMTPGFWRIRVETESPALLLVAETAFPGWTATVDQSPAQWQPAYTAIRAMCVPAGAHTIEQQFSPTIFWIGGGLSLATLIVLLVAGWRVRAGAGPTGDRP
ncbi:MAG: hypothetical protein R3300_02160 [Candidatus Promineifilaceae bacterium]|nr:hypothetical protein [Candidatus Promineifilaceae bacterium]